jgi:glycosyltransferase involved in cell wall biosynthesis
MLKLLVFAHTPPPVHGQSVMVATLVEGLRADPDIAVLHVNARFSHDTADVGRIRPGKSFALLGAVIRAWRLRARHGPAAFYYVPAPGKRGALYRDFLVLLLCRPFFRRLVLHWHAIGLGEWLNRRAFAPERWLARRLLGRADVSLVLAPIFTADADVLVPRQVAVVPNCVPDPGPAAPRPPRAANAPTEVLFLGLCTREKGLFVTLDAVAQANAHAPGSFRLTVAGGFRSADENRVFHDRMAQLPAGSVRYVGFADEDLKRTLFAAADVFCFPTAYAHEGQPLALVEALAHDLPIITTRWRAIPSMLPPEFVWYVDHASPTEIAAALAAARLSPRPAGALREHYLRHYTPAAHLRTLKSALLAVAPP